MSDTEIVRLWTRQGQNVLDVLERDGICRVKRAYISSKYGESHWSFKIAYNFFAGRMAQLLPPGEGEELPYWLHGTAEAAGFRDSPLLCLDIPREQCLFFDRPLWSRVLNLDYIPLSDQDDRDFHRKMTEQGISHSSQAFRLPYYPAIKKEIERSWERLFSAELPEPGYLQAAVWHIKREWLVEA